MSQRRIPPTWTQSAIGSSCYLIVLSSRSTLQQGIPQRIRDATNRQQVPWAPNFVVHFIVHVVVCPSVQSSTLDVRCWKFALAAQSCYRPIVLLSNRPVTPIFWWFCATRHATPVTQRRHPPPDTRHPTRDTRHATLTPCLSRARSPTRLRASCVSAMIRFDHVSGDWIHPPVQTVVVPLPPERFVPQPRYGWTA